MSRGSSVWRTTAKLSVTQLVGWGVLYYAFGVCLPLAREELGWSEARLSAGFSLGLLVSGFTAPLVGAWIDRYGSRGLMLGGSLVGGAGVVAWSTSRSLPSYLFAWFLIGLALATTLYEPAFATVIRAHPRRSRTSIVTIALVGALASTVFIPLSSALFASVGWRSGLLVLALGFVLVTAPLHATLPAIDVSSLRKQNATELTRLVSEPVDARSFWVISVALMLTNIVAVSVNTYAVALLMRRGQSAEAAAFIVGLMGFAKLGGRLLAAAGRRFSAVSRLRGALLLQAVALPLPFVWPSTGGWIVMIALFGATSGARTILRPELVVETFGRTTFGKRNGLLQLVTTVAKSTAPVGVGVAVGAFGYTGAWLGLAALAAASGVLLFALPRARRSKAQSKSSGSKSRSCTA